MERGGYGADGEDPREARFGMGAGAGALECITKWRDAGYIEMSYREV